MATKDKDVANASAPAPKEDATVQVQHVDDKVTNLNLFVKDAVVEFRDGVANVEASLAKELKKLGFVK